MTTGAGVPAYARLVRIGLRSPAPSARDEEPPSLGQLRALWHGRIGLVLWTLLVLVFFWPMMLAATEPVLAMSAAVLPLVAIAETVPVWLLRSYPTLAWYSATAVAVVLPEAFRVLDSDPWTWPPMLGMTLLVAFPNVCARGRPLAVVGAWLSAPLLFWTHSQPNTKLGWTVLLIAIAGVVVAVRVVRGTRRELGRERQLTEAEKSRRAALEERARIARDLHDVVAHHMSMVVVQAETAPYRLTGLSPEAAADFAAISQTAREALNEVRGLLGVLRSEEISVDLRPQPGLDQLDELVATAVRAGARVDVSLVGAARPVRPGVDVGAYRILQESLANAARHAPGAPIRVEVRYDPDAVRLAVLNPTGAADPTLVTAAGHGLTGMAERASVVGGELSAGPTPDGGFAVLARLPTPTLPEPDALLPATGPDPTTAARP
jgi:signal transduction histidine kinase